MIQKSENPGAVPPAPRAKPNKTNGILHHVKRALFATFYILPEAFILAVVALAALGGHHGL
jgi:hypothetical protein